MLKANVIMLNNSQGYGKNWQLLLKCNYSYAIICMLKYAQVFYIWRTKE